MRGGYAGHGETFMNPEDILWWSHGGKLHGESPARIRFLHEILTQTPGLGLKQGPGAFDETVAVPDEMIPVTGWVHGGLFTLGGLFFFLVGVALLVVPPLRARRKEKNAEEREKAS